MSRVKKRGFWTDRRVTSVLVMGWLVWLGVGLVIPASAYGALLYSQGVTYNGDLYSQKIGTSPAVSYRANITLTTVGPFAAMNDITMKAVIYDSNVTNLKDSFAALAFMNATYPEAANYSQTGEVVVPTLTQHGAGVWTAAGKLFFEEPVSLTGAFLVPINSSSGPTFICLKCLYTPSLSKQIAKTPFPGSIGPSSDSNAVVSDYTVVKYAVALASFSLLAVRPLLRGRLVQKDRRWKEKRG